MLTVYNPPHDAATSIESIAASLAEQGHEVERVTIDGQPCGIRAAEVIPSPLWTLDHYDGCCGTESEHYSFLFEFEADRAVEPQLVMDVMTTVAFVE